MDKNDPTEPIENDEPTEAIEQKESFDQSDQPVRRMGRSVGPEAPGVFRHSLLKHSGQMPRMPG
jgi:hypothetical protein